MVYLLSVSIYALPCDNRRKLVHLLLHWRGHHILSYQCIQFRSLRKCLSRYWKPNHLHFPKLQRHLYSVYSVISTPKRRHTPKPLYVLKPENPLRPEAAGLLAVERPCEWRPILTVRKVFVLDGLLRGEPVVLIHDEARE